MKHHLSPLLSRPAQALGFCGAFFAPIKMLAFALGALVLADLVTGVWASAKRGHAITSGRLGRSVSKSIVYLLAIVVAHVTELYVFGPEIPIVKVVGGLIGTTELLSFFENVESITGVPFRKRLGFLFGREQPEKKEDRDE